MALAQRRPPGLKAVVNVAGGLISAIAWRRAWMRSSRPSRHWPWKDTLPQLWVYAGNDDLFPPSLVDGMRAAALDRGGDVRLIALPDVSPRGHAILQNGRARFVWLREMDTSLRA
ncbi:Dienelactone hydrolase OS=Bosea thiooxidans OX=53254 GN=SAMN05660750_02845 PE=4 SV=1 [Bosea thiooxidans]